MNRFLSLLMISFCCFSSMAQDTLFWFCPSSAYITRAYFTGSNGGFVFTNTTPRTATVTIEYFKSGLTETFTIAANSGYHHKRTKNFIATNIIPQYKATTSPLPTNPGYVANTGSPGDVAGIVQSGGVKITSDEKILCYFFYDDDATKEIFILKGKNALGKEFYVPQSSDGYYLNGQPATGALQQHHVNARDMV